MPKPTKCRAKSFVCLPRIPVGVAGFANFQFWLLLCDFKNFRSVNSVCCWRLRHPGGSAQWPEPGDFDPEEGLPALGSRVSGCPKRAIRTPFGSLLDQYGSPMGRAVGMPFRPQIMINTSFIRGSTFFAVPPRACPARLRIK